MAALVDDSQVQGKEAQQRLWTDANSIDSPKSVMSHRLVRHESLEDTWTSRAPPLPDPFTFERSKLPKLRGPSSHLDQSALIFRRRRFSVDSPVLKEVKEGVALPDVDGSLALPSIRQDAEELSRDTPVTDKVKALEGQRICRQQTWPAPRPMQMEEEELISNRFWNSTSESVLGARKFEIMSSERGGRPTKVYSYK